MGERRRVCRLVGNEALLRRRCASAIGRWFRMAKARDPTNRRSAHKRGNGWPVLRSRTVRLVAIGTHPELGCSYPTTGWSHPLLGMSQLVLLAASLSPDTDIGGDSGQVAPSSRAAAHGRIFLETGAAKDAQKTSAAGFPGPNAVPFAELSA